MDLKGKGFTFRPPDTQSFPHDRKLH